MASAARPAASAGRGRGRPMTPVEATSTSAAGTFSPWARVLAVQAASASPALPVQALAQPELITTALAPGPLASLAWQ